MVEIFYIILFLNLKMVLLLIPNIIYSLYNWSLIFFGIKENSTKWYFIYSISKMFNTYEDNGWYTHDNIVQETFSTIIIVFISGVMILFNLTIGIPYFMNIIGIGIIIFALRCVVFDIIFIFNHYEKWLFDYKGIFDDYNKRKRNI